MPTAALDAKPSIRLPITLPADLYAAFERQAESKNVPVEDLIARHIARTVSFTAERPLYFDDAQRQELETILGGRHFDNPKKVLDELRHRYTMRLDGRALTLAEDLYHALRIRCAEIHADPAVVIREQALAGIRRFVWGE